MTPYNQRREGTEQQVHGGQATGGGHPNQGGQQMGASQAQGGASQAQGEVGQAPGAGQGATAEPTPIGEMTVDAPTLRWVSIERPGDSVPIGPDDYVLESVFNPGLDAWEVLVLVQPRDAEEEADEGDED